MFDLISDAQPQQDVDVQARRLKRTREKRCSKKVFHGDLGLELLSRLVAEAAFLFPCPQCHSALIQRIANERNVPRDAGVAAGSDGVMHARFQPAAVAVAETL